jgi:hypothetical protein
MGVNQSSRKEGGATQSDEEGEGVEEERPDVDAVIARGDELARSMKYANGRLREANRNLRKAEKENEGPAVRKEIVTNQLP